MATIINQKGVSSFAIILLALLVLVVVLANGIAISVRKDKVAQADQLSGLEIALSYCSSTHEKFPEQCKVSRVYQCDSNYLLRTGCIGVGDVILSKSGDFVRWCGYTSLEGEAPSCGTYWVDTSGSDCTKTKNLCL